MNSAFMMVRPCAGIYTHMRQLLDHDTHLHFKQETAAQSFLEWYFR